MLCCAQPLSRVQLLLTQWTVAYQAPLSIGILQARILEWVVLPSSRGSSQPRYPALQADSLPSKLPGKWRILECVAYSFSKGSNWHLLCCRQILYQLNYQGSPAMQYTLTYIVLHVYYISIKLERNCLYFAVIKNIQVRCWIIKTKVKSIFILDQTAVSWLTSINYIILTAFTVEQRQSKKKNQFHCDYIWFQKMGQICMLQTTPWNLNVHGQNRDCGSITKGASNNYLTLLCAYGYYL